MSPKPTPHQINQYIIQTVREERPETIQQLIQLVQKKHHIPQQEILHHILHLQEEGKIHLKPPPTPPPEKFTEYLSSHRALWYWITLTVTVATAFLVFTVPGDAYPLVYARHILGSIYVLWLPGYTFIKALFPHKELDNIERTALSIGMSLALVPITGLLLNYTPWGIRLTPITLTLLALTITLATAAILREHHTTPKQTPKQ